MKKTFILLALCIAFISTHAQKIDSSLICGKWDLYSMKVVGFTYCRDSLPQNIETLVQKRKASNPKPPSSSDDSLKLLNKIKADLNDAFKSYITFDKTGKSAVQHCENGVCTEETGTYSWSGENKFTQKIGKADPQVFVIREMTAKKLTIKAEDDDDGTAIEMSFTRAK